MNLARSGNVMFYQIMAAAADFRSENMKNLQTIFMSANFCVRAQRSGNPVGKLQKQNDRVFQL